MGFSIGGVSSQLSAMQERWQALQSSKGTVSKSDLETVKNNAEQFLSNFDTIDTNGDGISTEELQTYAKANGISLPSGDAFLGGLGGFPGGGLSVMGPMGGFGGMGPIGGFGGIGGVSGGKPPSMSKDELTAMKDNMTAHAQEASEGLGKLIDSFAQVDTDSDDKVSASEVKTFADANGLTLPHGPGFLASMSKDELTAMKDNMTAHAQEASEGLGKLIDAFDQVDTDGDGKASASEVKTFADANGLTLPHGPGFPGAGDTTESSSQSQDSTTNSENGNASGSSVSGLASLMMRKILNSYLTFGADAQQGIGSLLNNVTA